MQHATASPISQPSAAIAHLLGSRRARQCSRALYGRPHSDRAANAAMLYQHKVTPAEYKAGLDLAVERGWLELHESGSFVRFHAGWQRSVCLKQEPTEGCRICLAAAAFPPAPSGCYIAWPQAPARPELGVFDGLQSDRFADSRLSTPALDAGDKLALEPIAEAIADLEAEKASLHPPDGK
jgi:hypothetical protein